MQEDKCKYCSKTYSEFYSKLSDKICKYCLNIHNSDLKILLNCESSTIEKKSRICWNPFVLFESCIKIKHNNVV